MSSLGELLAQRTAENEANRRVAFQAQEMAKEIAAENKRLRSRLAEAEARHDVWPPFGESFTVPVDKMDAQFIAWLRDNCVIVTRESWERLNRGTAPDACPHDRCAQRLDGETITVTCTKCGRQATGVIGQSWTAPDSTGSAPGTGR